MKKPFLAAALNLIPGVGYLYISTKRVLGWLLLATSIAAFISLFDPSLNLPTPEPQGIWNVWYTLTFMLPYAAFVIDGYLEAKKANTTRLRTTNKTEGEEVALTTKTTIQKPISKSQRRKGILVASLAIPVGIIAWDILWNFGFIASVISYGIAWAAIKLYTKSTSARPDKEVAKILLGIIVLGVVLSFLSGMAMDAQLSYSDQMHISAIQAFTRGDFWIFYLTNLGYGDIWSQYVGDIIVSLVFAALGSYGIVKDLFIQNTSSAEATKESAKTN
jgi:hypothetical protein